MSYVVGKVLSHIHETAFTIQIRTKTYTCTLTRQRSNSETLTRVQMSVELGLVVVPESPCQSLILLPRVKPRQLTFQFVTGRRQTLVRVCS